MRVFPFALRIMCSLPLLKIYEHFASYVEGIGRWVFLKLNHLLVLQLKLYQAFIFSIPILFSIILFLLFYLFYIKRRAFNSSNRPLLPTATSFNPTPCQLSLKREIADKLPTVLFDEELRTRDTQCSFCLVDFEVKEELLLLPSCKHVFHIECMHGWLRSNLTCPLCRCCVSLTITKIHHHHSIN
ncbi:probable E3 ubiquitin-protein ligase RHA4A [Hibiscus syriacus]|uniref:probable E3 ubiquitin-protein ligase RHA4A n=1 Tax=Hibiscus syriacus TaxID=106335 RepID=UPI001923EB66|nr:probable E3 ubiquitin-protein ligase RHA4A [Hibiscus syriacus]